MANQYAASGLMGDTNDLKVTGNAATAHNNQFAVSYKPSGSNGWAGLYWQYPAGNWGDKGNGFNLQGATSLTFNAKGNGTVSEFMVGGITSKTGASDSSKASIQNVKLTGDWKQYTIDLTGKDLTNILGGFGFTASKAANTAGLTMDVKDIMFNFGKK